MATLHPQRQRFAQLIKPHQHPSLFFQPDDFFLEPLEQRWRGALRHLIPVDQVNDRCLELLATDVLLGAGFEVIREAVLLRKGFDLPAAHGAQSAGVGPAGTEQFLEVLCRGPRQVEIPGPQRVQQFLFLRIEDQAATCV
jgi:hypothetical protein